ncbi:Hypothetical protein ORPV_1032 [Orpheovirus IHUMI-LCC2]|uniref:Uncharacterized protein n=1 Tax=Orpheovirus IHUMI-LCC2 TaxID=2023057 RepID=A0A2I2L5Z3_9VIRU|nr:Hypothetical protein ORPV_1032 [Orpheovirus IHUMI-LCC2]SNW62936.1 Hypothetical protein ORPV_1032 [Orpheovirus IHUMI-LCC2]
MERIQQAYIIKDLDKFRKTEGVISTNILSKNSDGTIWVTALISHPKGRIYDDNVIHFEQVTSIGPSKQRDVHKII